MNVKYSQEYIPGYISRHQCQECKVRETVMNIRVRLVFYKVSDTFLNWFIDVSVRINWLVIHIFSFLG
jgi:hypothetical protein